MNWSSEYRALSFPFCGVGMLLMIWLCISDCVTGLAVDEEQDDVGEDASGWLSQLFVSCLFSIRSDSC